MRPDYRWLVVFAGNIVFLLLVGQANHYLTDVSWLGLARGQMYLFVLGLPLAFAALRLNLASAVLATVGTALAVEAGLPVTDGAVLLPASACVCVTIAFRAHFNRFEISTAIFAGLIMNLVMMIAITVVVQRGGGVSLPRILVDLLLSQLALAGLTAWFFAAQTELLRVFGYDLDTELREPS